MEENKKFIISRHEMVVTQLINRDIKDGNVLNAMKKIARHLFVDKNYQNEAYSDYPLPIIMGQTISQPYIVALMTQELELKSTDKVLEIGTGSGYQTAVLAEIADEVFTIETINELLIKAENILESLDYKNIHFKNSDGYKGWSEEAPFDKIIVTAAPKEIPDLLTDQLKNKGIMLIPIGLPGRTQSLIKIIKSDNHLVKEEICSVAFVPLIKEKF
ncbi:MAG: protein-L-isoaspartate(D-aspartate) O-methyltransferase [Candidatus Humimicrobiaceae bacterium]